MKIGIVGSGLVGATAAYALVMRGVGSEIVLVDRDEARASAEADDILHAVPFAHPLRVFAGDYSMLASSQVVIIAAGVSQKPGETRLQLLGRNAAVFRQVVPSILEHAPNAVLVVATNPVDVMTHLAGHYAAQGGVPSSRVIGSGTTLDTARFRSLLGRHLGVDATHIHGYVVGEHGDSEVITWSSVDIGGLSLDSFCAQEGTGCEDDIREAIDDRVRYAAYRIIEGKGSTYYGIGSALSHIVNVILRDQRAMLTVCTPLEDVVGVKNVTVSLPHLLGGEGIRATFMPQLDAAEESALRASAQIIRDALAGLEAEGVL
jgi:L-lactate dehydrogenase